MRDADERWMKLCQQARRQQDPKKLLTLVKEINDLLEFKEKRRVDSLTSALNDRVPGTSSH